MDFLIKQTVVQEQTGLILSFFLSTRVYLISPDHISRSQCDCLCHGTLSHTYTLWEPHTYTPRKREPPSTPVDGGLLGPPPLWGRRTRRRGGRILQDLQNADPQQHIKTLDVNLVTSSKNSNSAAQLIQVNNFSPTVCEDWWPIKILAQHTSLLGQFGQQKSLQEREESTMQAIKRGIQHRLILDCSACNLN
jgi:hypothetical protein